MKKTKKELIAERFDSITEAAICLHLTRRSVYKIINSNKITTRARNIIIYAGYNPETLAINEAAEVTKLAR